MVTYLIFKWPKACENRFNIFYSVRKKVSGTITWYHHMLTEWLKWKRLKNFGCWWGNGATRILITLMGGMVQFLWKNWQYLIKINICIVAQHFHSRYVYPSSPKDMDKNVHISIICGSLYLKTTQMHVSTVMDNCGVFIQRDITQQWKSTVWMDFTYIVLSERHQRRKEYLIVWFYLREVPNQANLIHYVRGQDSRYLVEWWQRVQGFLRCDVW